MNIINNASEVSGFADERPRYDVFYSCIFNKKKIQSSKGESFSSSPDVSGIYASLNRARL